MKISQLRQTFQSYRLNDPLAHQSPPYGVGPINCNSSPTGRRLFGNNIYSVALAAAATAKIKVLLSLSGDLGFLQLPSIREDN